MFGQASGDIRSDACIQTAICATQHVDAIHIGFHSPERAAIRVGRRSRLPPQLGHFPPNTLLTQGSQKVHSWEQIIAMFESCGRSTPQFSQSGLSSSMTGRKGVSQYAKCAAFDAGAVFRRVGKSKNDLCSAVQLFCRLVQSQSERIAHQSRLADQVVPAKLVFIDLNIHRLIKIIFDGSHQKQVIVDVALRGGFRKEQHSCVIANIECDCIVLAAVCHRLTFTKNTPYSLRHRTACRDLLRGVR